MSWCIIAGNHYLVNKEDEILHKSRAHNKDGKWSKLDKREMEQSVIIKFREGEIINNWALGLLEHALFGLHILSSVCDLILLMLPLHFLFFTFFRCLNHQRSFSFIQWPGETQIIVTCFMCLADCSMRLLHDNMERDLRQE